MAAETNITDEPITMIVDTGSQITLLANDMIRDDVEILPKIYKLTGISGKSNPVTTKGNVNAHLIFGSERIPEQLSLIDREHAGPFDGYIGHGFLKKNNAVIDMRKNEVKLQIDSKQACDPTFQAARPTNNELQEDKNTQVKTVSLYGYYEDEQLNWEMESEADENEVNVNSVAIKNSEEKGDDVIPEFEIYACHEKYKLEGATVCMEDADDQIEKLKYYVKRKMKLPAEPKQYLRCFANQKIKQTVPKENNMTNRRIVATRKDAIMNELRVNKCSEAQQQKIEAWVDEFQNQFYLPGDRLDVTPVITHTITLKKDARVVNVRQGRIPDINKRKLEKEIDDLKQMGVIRESTSPYNSRAFFVPKRDDAGTKTGDRMVIDYRELNDQTEVEEFPIPLIDEILDDLGGNKYFTILDIKSAYYQIELAEDSKHLTAFSTPYNKYEFNRVPMGLAGAPLTFQKAVNKIFSDLLGRGINVYMDDVAISAKSENEHDRLLQIVLQRIRENNLKLRINKCQFYAAEIHYLGFVISEQGIKPNPGKIECIERYPHPKNRLEVQRFLGMMNYYRRFIKDFAGIAKPLSKLTSPLVEFIWNDACREAFEALKHQLITHVTLKIPDFSQPFIISTDASSVACGATLSQGDIQSDRPIAFFSKAMSSAQQKLPAIQQEILAMIEGINAFRPYLHGRPFIVVTDHEPLKYLFNLKNKNSSLHKYRLELADLDFKIVYRPGRLNNVADALSRIDISEAKSLKEILSGKDDETEKKTCAVTTRSAAKQIELAPKTHRRICILSQPGVATTKQQHEAIFTITSKQREQKTVSASNDTGEIRADKQFEEASKGQFITIIDECMQSGMNELTKKMYTICEQRQYRNFAINALFSSTHLIFALKFELGKVFEKYACTATIYMNKVRELTDPREIETALYQHHKTKFGGHCGTKRMSKTLTKVYKWHGMSSDIKRYVKQCEVCEKTKTTGNMRTPMQITSTGSKPFDHVYVDFIGPINPPSNGYKYIFVATCDLTKYTVAQPTIDCTAESTAEAFLNEIIMKFGFPTQVTSDNAQNFTGKLFKELNKKLKIKQITTTPYHPQANIVERQNRSINQYLRAFTEKKPQDWAKLLPFYVFSYNHTVHSTTEYTPHHLLYGYDITMPSQITKNVPVYNYDNYVEVVRGELHDALQLAKERLMKRKEQNKNIFDRRANTKNIEPGDFVLIKNHNRKSKLDPIWLGPVDIDWADEKYITAKIDGVYKKISLDDVKKSEAWHLPDDAIERYILSAMKRLQEYDD